MICYTAVLYNASMTLMARNVPDELHRALKLQAVERGVTLNALVIELLSAVSGKVVRVVAVENVSHFHPDPKSGVR